MPKRIPLPAKLQSLRHLACLNPHPDAVTDPLFADSDFFDPHDLVQVKYEMLRRVDQDGESITDAAARFGFSRPSFYQAQSAFQAGGLAALAPLKRGPKKAHKLTPDVVEFLRQSRHRDPTVAVPELMRRIQQQFSVSIHRRTIERTLTRMEKKRRPQTGPRATP